jgi:hypothetical protein
MDRQRALDRAVFATARRQHGVIARRQLVELGMPTTMIDVRLRAGRFVLLHRGVYALGHAQLRPEGRWCDAVLAVGPGAALSHRHAGALWGLVDPPAGPIHVSLPGHPGRARRRNVVVHRPDLPLDEVTEHRGVSVTTVGRTLLDLAAVVRSRDLELAVRRAARARVFDRRDLESLAERHPRHRGRRAVASLLAAIEGRGTAETRSRMELRFLQMCDDFGLPRPVCNGFVLGERVDFHWRDAKVVVETDGFDFHALPSQFTADRARDRLLTLAGWTPVRFAWDDVRLEPSRVAAEVAALLSRSGAS